MTTTAQKPYEFTNRTQPGICRALHPSWITVLRGAFSHISPALARADIPLSRQRIGCVAIDAEEDFDWDSPMQGTAKSTFHLRNLRMLAEILQAYGATPTYLLTYPVLQDEDAVAIIRHQLEAGLCDAGLQLHPWVTPPFGEDVSLRASFLGNLSADREEQKLLSLRARFIKCFGIEPKIYRAGRYGLSLHTPALLEKHGFTIDTSIAPRTSFVADGGPDFRDFDSRPFWFGKQRRLLEVPLCRDIVGWGGGGIGAGFYSRMAEHGEHRSGLLSLLARSRCVERITLSPEGNDISAMLRLLRGKLARGDTLFPLSFHSSSLQDGTNPYVRRTADLHEFYDRLSGILSYMTDHLGFRFMALADVPGALAAPTAAAIPMMASV